MSETSGGRLSVAEGSLSHAAARVGETREDLHRLSQQLSGQIDALRSSWTGAGGDAFWRLHLAWQDRQRTIAEALTELESGLLETEQATLAADQAQQDLMTRTASRLG